MTSEPPSSHATWLRFALLATLKTRRFGAGSIDHNRRSLKSGDSIGDDSEDLSLNFNTPDQRDQHRPRPARLQLNILRGTIGPARIVCAVARYNVDRPFVKAIECEPTIGIGSRRPTEIGIEGCHVLPNPTGLV